VAGYFVGRQRTLAEIALLKVRIAEERQKVDLARQEKVKLQAEAAQAELPPRPKPPPKK